MRVCGQQTGWVYIWVLVHNPVPSVRGAKQVDEDNVLLRDVVLLENLDRLAHLVPRPHDGVEEQHLPVGDVVRELSKDHVRLMGLRVTVHQHLAREGLVFSKVVESKLYRKRRVLTRNGSKI